MAKDLSYLNKNNVERSGVQLFRPSDQPPIVPYYDKTLLQIAVLLLNAFIIKWRTFDTIRITEYSSHKSEIPKLPNSSWDLPSSLHRSSILSLQIPSSPFLFLSSPTFARYFFVGTPWFLPASSNPSIFIGQITYHVL